MCLTQIDMFGESAGKEVKKKIALGLLGTVIVLTGGYWTMNRPPNLEYLKEHPEEFKFKKFKKVTELNFVLRELIPVGTSKEKVNNLLVGIAGSFKTLEYYENEDKEWQSRQEGKEYQIVYFSADKIVEGNFPWMSTGWEVWIKFTPKNHLKSYEIKRINHIASIIQKHYLYDNPENLQRKIK